MTHSEQWVPYKYRAGSGRCVMCRKALKVDEQECCQRCQRRVAKRAMIVRLRHLKAEKNGTARKRPSVTNGPPPPFVPRFVVDTSVRRSGVGKLFE